MYDKKVTIIIPTKNRSARLKIALQYYISKKFLGKIIVADYSTGRSINAVDAIVNMAKRKGLNLTLHKCSKKHDGDAIKSANELIDTPYVMSCGDDCIAIRKSIIKCVEFLDWNHDYTAASGIRGTKLECGEYTGMHYTACLEVESKYILERLISYLRTRINTLNYVHRTEVWQDLFQYADMMPNEWLGAEVLPCCLSVMSGKIKDALTNKGYHAIHQLYNDKQNINFMEIVSSSDYAKSAKIMRKVIIRSLIEGGIDPNKAEKIYSKEIWLSTLFVMMNKFVEQHPQLKPIIDEYNSSLDNYPFEWRLLDLPTTLVSDPMLQKLLDEIKALNDPFGHKEYGDEL